MNLINKMMKNLTKDVYEYFSETTVHGFQYIVTGRNWFERLFWASLIVCGFILGSMIFYHSLHDWNETPLQTTIKQVSLPIEELNYPSVTVCNPAELQMPRRNRWMYLEKLLNWIDVEKGNFSFIKHTDGVIFTEMTIEHFQYYRGIDQAI